VRPERKGTAALLALLVTFLAAGCEEKSPVSDTGQDADGREAVPDLDVQAEDGEGADSITTDGSDPATEDLAPDVTEDEVFDLPHEPTWIEIGRQDTTRFVSGTVMNGRIYAGTHLGGSSAIYDYPPLRMQQFFGGESVLDLCEFGGSLYSTHENGSRIYRLSGDAWELVYDRAGWDYMFFMILFQGALLATGGTAETVFLVGTDDGATFSEIAVMPGWNWVPVEYRGELYLLGHDGAAYAGEPASGLKSGDGVNFSRVDALFGGPEYQCACVWNDILYLGTGGWTNGRERDDLAVIYAYDGATRAQVFTTDKNGVTSIAAFQGRLYATVDTGWERAPGDSRLYESTDGITWTLTRTLPDPEMRAATAADDSSLILFGGQAGGYGVIYSCQ
jgi:hypothetical protein